MSSPARKPRSVDDSPKAVDPNRMVLFTAKGITYTIPSKVPANLFLRYLRETRNRGTDVALMGLLENMAGPDAMRALLDYDGLDDDTLEEILRGLSNMVQGRVDITGN